MKRVVKHSTLVVDIFDPEWREKLRALKRAGVDGLSTVLTVSRPAFSPRCEYPFLTVYGRQGDSYPDAEYDLLSYNAYYWRHFAEVLAECAVLGLWLQIDLFNEPSVRNGNPLCWNRWGENAANFRDTPRDTWAAIVWHYSRHAIQTCVDSPLRPVIFCVTLEGSGSWRFEKFVFGSVRDLLPEGSIVVSNSVDKFPAGTKFMFVYSPHVKSLAEVRAKASRGAFLSDDGWPDNGAGQIAAAVDVAEAGGCAAYESLLAGALSGELVLDAQGRPHGTAPQAKRARPDLARLSRGVTPEMVLALVR